MGQVPASRLHHVVNEQLRVCLIRDLRRSCRKADDKIDSDLTVEQAYQAARADGIGMLA